MSGLNLHLTPEVVQAAFARKDVWGPTPIFIVFDAAVEEVVGVLPYYHLKSPEGLQTLKAALADYRGQSPQPRPSHEMEAWTDHLGRSLRAAFVEAKDGKVTLRLESGRLSTIEGSTLSEASQKRVAELAAGAP